MREQNTMIFQKTERFFIFIVDKQASFRFDLIFIIFGVHAADDNLLQDVYKRQGPYSPARKNTLYR